MKITDIQPHNPGRSYEGATSPRSTEVGLDEMLRIMVRRRWLIAGIMVVTVLLGVLGTKATHKRWTATAKLIAIQHPDNAPEQLEQNYAAPVVENVDDQLSLIQSDAMFALTIHDMKVKAVEDGNSASSVEWTPDKLSQRTVINNPKDSNVMDVVVTGDSREQAVRYADAICVSFLEWKRAVARREVGEIADALAVHAAGARAELLASEQRLQNFCRTNDIADLDAQTKAVVADLDASTQEAADLQKELLATEARLQAEQEQLNLDKSIVAKDGGSFRDDTMIASLETQLQTEEMSRADLASKYKPKYPGVFTEVDANIQDTKARLAQALSGVLNEDKPSLASEAALYDDYKQTQLTEIYTAAKLAAAKDETSILEGREAQFPTLDTEYSDLSRQVDLANTIYTSLEGKLTAARLDENKPQSNVQIESGAVAPALPSWPNMKLNVALALLLGFFIAALAVVVAEQRDTHIRGMEDLAELVLAPIIGEIKPLSRSQAATLAGGGRVRELEHACEIACANLSLLAHQTSSVEMLDQQLILVSSAQPGEGKSVVASQFARTLATMGKRTLLVKAGIEGPDAFDASTQRLVGRSLDLSLASAMEFTTSTPGLPTLSVLHLRELINRAGEGSVVPRLTKILTGLRDQVDIVVIDAPSCASSADSLFIAQFADCIVHVVCSETATQDDIVRTHEAFRAATPPTLALLVNHAPRNHRSGRIMINEIELTASLQNRLQGTQFSPPGLAQPSTEEIA